MPRSWTRSVLRTRYAGGGLQCVEASTSSTSAGARPRSASSVPAAGRSRLARASTTACALDAVESARDQLAVRAQAPLGLRRCIRSAVEHAQQTGRSRSIVARRARASQYARWVRSDAPSALTRRSATYFVQCPKSHQVFTIASGGDSSRMCVSVSHKASSICGACGAPLRPHAALPERRTRQRARRGPPPIGCAFRRRSRSLPR